MSELRPEDRAFVESIRDEWGPSHAAPPSPASIQARLAAKPWLAEVAPERRVLTWQHLLGSTLATVGLCAVGFVALRSEPAPISPTSAHVTEASPSAVSAAPAIEPAVSIHALPDAPPLGAGANVQPALGSRARESVSPSIVPPTPSAPAETLAEELVLIREAQSALRSGDADRTLAAVSAHESRFPRGVLRDERTTLEILALCARGDVAAARAAKAAFERSSPGSSHLQRLASSCAR